MTTLKSPPTQRQREVFDFIVAFIADRAYPPTRGEIQVGVGLRHRSAVMSHLIALRRKGWLTWQDGEARTIRILKGGDA